MRSLVDIKERLIQLNGAAIEQGVPLVELLSGLVHDLAEYIEQSPHKQKKPPAPTREDFEVFWKAYPRKVGKGQAQRSWNKCEASLEAVLRAIATQKQSAQWLKDGGQYIPHPATWLNGCRWLDEFTAPADEYPEDKPDRWEREHRARLRRMSPQEMTNYKASLIRAGKL